MKEKRSQRIKVIQASDPVAFQEKFNVFQESLQSKPKTIYNITPELYQAIVEYEVVEAIPESAADELRQEGLSFTCSDCPKFRPDLNNDGTIRRTSEHGKCILCERTRSDSAVCEWFCKKFLKGEVSPVGGVR